MNNLNYTALFWVLAVFSAMWTGFHVYRSGLSDYFSDRRASTIGFLCVAIFSALTALTRVYNDQPR